MKVPLGPEACAVGTSPEHIHKDCRKSWLNTFFFFLTFSHYITSMQRAYYLHVDCSIFFGGPLLGIAEVLLSGCL